MFCAPGRVFGGTEGVVSRFHVLCSRTHFRRCRVRQVPFSVIVHTYSFSTVPRASGPVFMFCVPGLFSAVSKAAGPILTFCAPRFIFDDTEGVRSCFHVSHSRTRFRRYRERQVPFSCFAISDSFSAVPRASGPVFIFCAPGLIFGVNEGVGSRFLVLRTGLVVDGIGGVGSRFLVMCARTRFRRY
jgi:hypothetical protein